MTGGRDPFLGRLADRVKFAHVLQQLRSAEIIGGDVFGHFCQTPFRTEAKRHKKTSRIGTPHILSTEAPMGVKASARVVLVVEDEAMVRAAIVFRMFE